MPNLQIVVSVFKSCMQIIEMRVDDPTHIH